MPSRSWTEKGSQKHGTVTIFVPDFPDELHHPVRAMMSVANDILSSRIYSPSFRIHGVAAPPTVASTIATVTAEAIVDSATAAETEVSACPLRLAKMYALAPVGMAESRVMTPTSIGGR
jgi:hypothetical protein